MPGEARGRRAATAAGALLALGLSDAAPPAPLEVEFAGCASVRADGGQLVCETVSQTSLRLWTAAPPGAPLDVLIDGRLHPADARPLAGGAALDLSVPGGARELHLVSGRARF